MTFRSNLLYPPGHGFPTTEEDDVHAATARSRERYKKAAAMRKRGLTNKQIGERLGMSQRSVAMLFVRARDRGWPVPDSPHNCLPGRPRPTYPPGVRR